MMIPAVQVDQDKESNLLYIGFPNQPTHPIMDIQVEERATYFNLSINGLFGLEILKSTLQRHPHETENMHMKEIG